MFKLVENKNEKIFKTFIHLLSLSLTLTLSCKVDDTGYIEGKNLQIKPCEDDKDKIFESYKLTGNFFTILNEENSAVIIMKDSYQADTKSDAFYIQITDFNKLKDLFNQKQNSSLELEFDEKFLRANLIPLRTCPDVRTPLMASGKISFSELGTENSDRIKINLNFDLINGRNASQIEKIGSDFVGKLDFEVKDFLPYKPFSNVD